MLTILAGAMAVPLTGARAKTPPVRWHGVALGAEATIVLDHPNAGNLIPQAVAEIGRLEKIFSLYRSESDLSRLNRDGFLTEPAFELVELLSLCSALNARTDGAFDPTVQALWSLYARRFSNGHRPDEAQISRARLVTGWDQVKFSPQKIAYRQPGVAMTLNGIAQGFIADRIAALFRRNGVRDVLVNTGEIAALGRAPDGLPWQVKLQTEPQNGVQLSDGAIATSAPLGTTFDTAESVGHIIDPRTGYPGGKWSRVTVIARSAAEADGLSTAFCLMSRPEIAVAKGASEVLLS
jgi:thiamine biosynthesis lipoprotein